ncbi:hypothetical protein GCM10028828_20880 [Corynebacterium tapiri]
MVVYALTHVAGKMDFIGESDSPVVSSINGCAYTVVLASPVRIAESLSTDEPITIVKSHRGPIDCFVEKP